jgi:hypothetical protein
LARRCAPSREPIGASPCGMKTGPSRMARVATDRVYYHELVNRISNQIS